MIDEETATAVLAELSLAYPDWTVATSVERTRLWIKDLTAKDLLDPFRALDFAEAWPQRHPHEPPTLDQLISASAPRTIEIIEAVDAEPLKREPPDPASIHRVKSLVAQSKANLAGMPNGVDDGRGHWHGGPNPCPVCGGIAPNRPSAVLRSRP